MQAVVDQDESFFAIRKLQGKKSMKTIVGKNTLPIPNSTYCKMLKFTGIQSYHCFTYDRDINKVSLDILIFSGLKKSWFCFYSFTIMYGQIQIVQVGSL